jgi:glucosamine--fructose-6-phosphate aminotransferase (isomerizing)
MIPSHMAREVAEIPEAARRFLMRSANAVELAGAAMRARAPHLIVTIARGTSDHAATYLKYVTELAAGIPVASVGPSVASIYHRPLRLSHAACIGISQSGRSPDIVEALHAAGEGGAITLAITNFADAPMAQAASHCLALEAGVEQSVAATKTFVTSALAGLCLVADWTGDPALGAAIPELPTALDKSLAQDWSALLDRLQSAQSLFVLGRGPAYAIACEAALKFKETCGLHAEAYSSAEVLHGPAALAQGRFPVLALGIEDAALPQLCATAERLAAQGADVFVTGADVPGCIRLPSVSGLHPLAAPLTIATSFYGFVEHLARARGFDPDTPPWLNKVTETV